MLKMVSNSIKNDYNITIVCSPQETIEYIVKLKFCN